MAKKAKSKGKSGPMPAMKLTKARVIMKSSPGTKAPSGAEDKTINRIGGGMLTNRGIQK